MGVSIIHSARLVSGTVSTRDAWVRFDGGRVAAVGTGDAWRAGTDATTDVVDATAVAGAGAILTPGFVDLHGHGGAGVAYDDGADAIRTARALHRRHGTTRALISLVTASIDDLAARAGTIADVAATDPDVLGSHLEGPFLDPAHKGAHDARLLIDPSPDALARLLEAGRGTVRQVTIAPERPGAMAAIAALRDAGVVPAVGHTSADVDLARAAFEAGAGILTHAFNAMPGLHHRAPGPVAAAAASPGVTLELIADGVHLHPDVVRLAFAAAPGRIALVTDAMAAAGAPDGRYVLGGLEVDVEGGVARLAGGTRAIAGSTLTQDAALRRCVEAGVPLGEAVHALTSAPAQAIGRTDLGALAPGAYADAVLLTADLAVRHVWTAGVGTPGADGHAA
ncbi:N-acetylglucosamine-6-phosphate deacetylase [Microbacterium sp. SSW1-59]|uniref:N-acetylglucosamine-6-phosphate deacetylase n=1 Tax=Microbacterium xanthum TaxID=3079794 RepID=UPI002AD2ED63|nr:N-acetylglucosamine-6-phosphate deacetylase [Microbacterium sp. SSW1-59]MDZ8201465.1 N-acetylglucosamine-6-phosphate deacetylase [Microbacterium sp. SSW1-59]